VNLEVENKRPLSGWPLAYDCVALEQTVDYNKAFESK
jgi:hypothetical protein